MKFSLSWLRTHLDTEASLSEITDTLTRIGLELEGVEDRGAALAPFRVAYVIEAAQHPNADRLRACRVDYGDGIVSVVCGAPNARTGMKTVLGLSNLAGFETHPTTRFEVWALFGDEYYGRTTYISGTTVAGYGSPVAVNSGCFFETSGLATAAGVSGTCTGNNRNLWNAKLMSYYDPYKGTFGTLRFGVEVDYIERNTWSGAGGLSPKGNDKTAFTTMRWILP